MRPSTRQSVAIANMDCAGRILAAYCNWMGRWAGLVEAESWRDRCECERPVQFGGGLRDLHAIELALSRGRARVILGTVAVRDPQLVSARSGTSAPQRSSLGSMPRMAGWRRMAGDCLEGSAVDLARRMAEWVCSVSCTRTSRGMARLRGSMSGRVSSWPAQRSARDCIRGRGWCEDIRKLAAASADGIEGVIVGPARTPVRSRYRRRSVWPVATHPICRWEGRACKA